MLHESSHLCQTLYKTAAYDNAEHMQGCLCITLQAQVCPKSKNTLKAQNAVVGTLSTQQSCLVGTLSTQQSCLVGTLSTQQSCLLLTRNELMR